MLKTIVRVCQIAFFVLATAALAAWLGWFEGGRDRRPLEPFQRVLAERAAAEAVDSLPRREDVRRVVVGPIAGDLDGRVADLVLEEVEDAGYYEALSWDDALDDAGLRTPENATVPPGDLAPKIAAATKADGWIEGTVNRTSGRKGVGAQVDLFLRLRRLADGVQIPNAEARSTARIESRASLGYFAPWMEQVHPLWRLFLWLLFTAGLPFAAFPVVQAVTAKESNRANAVLLAAFVALDVLFAAALLGFRPSFGGAIVLLLAACAGFLYDFVVCDRIDEMR